MQPSDPIWEAWPSPAPEHHEPTIAEIVCSYPWNCQKALAVMHCESSGRPDAYDGFNVGLFQVAERFHSRRLNPGESLFDPAVNTRIAFEIYSEQGSGPWPSCGRFF